MRVAVLSSGGKDSAAAWWWAMCRGWTVEALVTVTITGDDSPMFQVPSTHVVERQADLAGVPWVNVNTSGEVPQDIEVLEQALGQLNIDGFVSGALRSDYQKARLERMAERLGVVSWTPLWHQSGHDHVKGMVEQGFEIMITGVSAEGLTDAWLGRILTPETFEELAQLAAKHRFHVEGEGGEYETLVVGGPHMNGRLEVKGTTHWDGVRGHYAVH
ncbi:MAG: diphthine--ammonia ligase [Candidatus Thermoplasmatota archaeon]|nr:diphthine--ammonia ligase [Candidatus Thermoplasmatota archaeon]MEC9194001.1 diphthine--ammonia ligase [Candidatus Thermoplasmatota archaeon]